RIIRQAPSRAEAKQRLQELEVAASLMERALGAEHFAALQRELGALASYHMTEAQAEAVVRLQLGQLAGLERDEIFKEYNDLRQKILGYERLLSDDRNVRAVIREELVGLSDKYGDERRTAIEGEVARLDLEKLLPEEANAVTISHEGYIKRMPLTVFRSQHRGGRGVTGGTTKEDDFVEHFFVCSSHDYLLCFTNRGQLYWLRVFDIPQPKDRASPGRAMANVLQLKPEERITSVIAVQKFDAQRDADKYLLMATRRGLVKKTALREYSNPRAGGIIGISLDEGDTLINVVLTRPGDEVVLCTRKGMAIRFDEANARAMGRATRGVKGIALSKEDEVVGLVVADPDGFLLTVCENGFGKRTPFGANTSVEASDAEATDGEAAEEPAEEPAAEGAEEESGERSTMYYRKQRRGGKGVHDIRTSERNGLVVGVAAVRENDDIMLISANGMVNRTHVHEIRLVGRNTQGVRVINLKQGDKLAALAPVAHEEDIPDEAVPATTPPEGSEAASE
ncbi:MAG TPA: DNA gyrase C-terminal beta-propeller domain-containing protein, partial [Gemmataceae bacterium]|nr:DNA gyrase C-terminal beta-propeller domain-containing protein [Gemmataceae bacterium]